MSYFWDYLMVAIALVMFAACLYEIATMGEEEKNADYNGRPRRDC